ncbi:magnesium-dependent deoxyribonuclease, TatD family [Syntrophotalea carbinolica DSM 2380]|uniref:Magnesium-dependent deoxyribonuclease, TatD family n=1 Tax=Syntrophotalea carbinolica (strain DSM 2380 / NBRC 103641 / GraBd1) TaxID=338963 RepID=Q3A0H2_SYNC1|nr:TatD family hydrolase [Syntrophotalea carbinolica]ABA90135.1 magnesium-dependent deoxyribonuclease, TatD family [Syntrophotalea carbinolica DSM 2380]
MLVDAHAHIDWYTDALPEALAQIERHRIVTMAVAMDVSAYLKAKEIAKSCRYIIPTFGIHPWEAAHYTDRLQELDDYLQETPLIGEAGLDFRYVKDEKLYPGQLQVFEYQCAWAQRLSKSMNLHTRGAESEVLELLRRYRIASPIIHWYGGPLDLVEAYLAEGCYFTVGVDVLNPRIEHSIAEVLPLDRILLETDNPDGYRWQAKEIGMPDLLLTILQKVAAIKQMSAAELEDKLWQNWQELDRRCSGSIGGQNF